MNRFDHILWRINGIAFFLILAFGLISVSEMMFSFFPTVVSRQHQEAAVESVDQNTHKKEYLNLGHADLFKNIHTLRIPLNTEANYRGCWSSRSGGLRRNYLFLDYSAMTSHWLFPGFQRLIPECHDLYVPLECNGVSRNVVSSIYEVAAAESCADGKTGNNNRITAVFSTADGENLAEIIPLAERILTVEQVSDNEVLIVHSNQKSTVGAVFSVQTGKKIRDANLSLAEQ